ncbi:helix-turn-helix domain-containing protein [Saliterribacillus persicus]|uniref:AraC family two component transcriptional regulator n=1 Tax=Saliterribacillus persicus TaxID=930114 RepID=A0A368XZ58_9BACI|nr:helix-turn-helix domain-containing protein [Saliterribacillus persicus]RCW73252.1 AraC family two component transcriptional regulator [Saliterribacillus persicus]
MKIMLVDDEALERTGIRMILSRNRSDVEIVAEAQNGKEAVDFALKAKPDIIFMDIKMPEFDGLTAIEEILAVLPDVKCIMVSAFDTFQYAKKAMRFGVKEYLLKPSKVSEILEAYDRMANEVESEKLKVQETRERVHRLERASSLVEKEFIVSLLMDHVHEFSTDEWKNWIDLETGTGFAAVFFFKSFEANPTREAKSKWYKILKNALEALGSDYSSIVGPLTAFQVPVFITCTADGMDIKNRDAFARRIVQKIQQDLHQCQVFVGIGTGVSNLDQFSRSYEEAVYALEFVQHNPGASYLSYNPRLEGKRNDLSAFEKEKKLLESIQKGEEQTSLQVFESYFQEVQKTANYHVQVIKKEMENLFIVLARAMKELGYSQDVQMNFDHFETSIQIKEAAKSHLVMIIKQVDEWRSKGVRGMLLHAKEYIEIHYSDAVTLEEVADEVGLSSYYLSKLFKEHFQETFIDYLTRVRMEKAKSLLLEGHMPLKEIALNIGYRDPNYFSRVFKREIGSSPSEYRNRYLKQRS